ncbi:hypothetical protein [Lentzea nigeriaca]|uniref:hypothetical protein n=1 Tax=Lentzea nigeriaca TaxID=1128665 RepID=UPI0019597875|nr:hypothetical protein [Lentzea nigeriaca]MBM7864308.1 hypothetical protein [Lentzea nigeriaca]
MARRGGGKAAKAGAGILKPALTRLRKTKRPAGAAAKSAAKKVPKPKPVPGAWVNKLSAKDKASYNNLKNAVNASSNRSAAQIRAGLSPRQLARGKQEPYLRSRFVGSEIEKDVARRVRSDTNISHLGTSQPGKAVPDFKIGGKHNVDVTGGSATSMRTHMNRPYYSHPDQVLTYPSVPKTKLDAIFR